ncbi:MAG: T9SS type A sorting domain-containing protein [Bacteroidetes bacterium]|nr:T9SS type A sorting domain-containing protein [Bacteroidota bacterium]MBL0257378.1 T9SS type A sorting domain-containing protein [Bacteroidota bacterium]
MKNIFLWPVLLAITHATCAQSLSPSVVSPGGSFSSNGGYSLSQTTGESSMVETFTSGSAILTQGFQQAEDGFVRVPEIMNSGYSIEVFPNPGNGHFYLEIKASHTTKVSVRVMDIIGQPVWTNPILSVGVAGRHLLDLSALSNGVYMAQLSVFDESGKEVIRKTERLQLVH